MAVLLSMTMVAASDLAARRRAWLLLALPAAALAGAVKITTACIYLVMVAAGQWRDARNERWSRRATVRALVLTAVVAAVCLGSGMAWAHYADHVKRQNPISAQCTSKQLTEWNFGSLHQRRELETWQKIADFTFPKGYGTHVVLVAALGVIMSSAYWRMGIALAAAALAGPLVFTNLYYVHSYYSAANQPLVVMAVGVGLAGWLERRLVGIMFLTAVAGLVAGNANWREYYRPSQTESGALELKLAQIVRDTTAEDEVTLLVGLDWCPVVPYLAQRRAVMVPALAPPGAVAEILGRLQQRVGSIVLPQDPRAMVGNSEGQWVLRNLIELQEMYGLKHAACVDGFQFYSAGHGSRTWATQAEQP
jgi:hypothetical protein